MSKPAAVAGDTRGAGTGEPERGRRAATGAAERGGQTSSPFHFVVVYVGRDLSRCRRHRRHNETADVREGCVNVQDFRGQNARLLAVEGALSDE